MIRTIACTLTVAALSSATLATAEAKDLRIALGLPEIYAAYEPLKNFAETLDSELGLPAKVYPMSLLTLAETAGGVRDGLADIGFVVFPYHPVEFSEVNLPANLSMLATLGEDVNLPGAAMAGATMEYTLLGCPDCQTQMAANNHVYLSGTATPPYRLLCNKPIKTLADVEGKRFRAGAGNYARWAEALGGSSVSVPGNEIYDSLSQGIVDCTMTPLGDLVGGRFVEVTSDVTLGVPGGVFSGLGAANVNRDVWQGLGETERAGMLRAAGRLAAESVFSYENDDIEGTAAAEEKGVTFHEGDETLTAASRKFVEEDKALVRKQFSETYRVEDVAAKMETIEALVGKWQGLTADLGADDVDALEALYWDEVLSRVDTASYGMK